ncbi:MAG: ZIP family metal transporter [Nanoarchaeota archaeon]
MLGFVGYTLISVLLISLISFMGLLFFRVSEKKLNRILIYLISIAAGALFGDVFIHLIPEISNNNGFTIGVSLSFLLGVLIFFILEKAIHSQHYHSDEHEHKTKNVKPLAYMSLTVSTIHNFLDGLVIALAYMVNIPAGIGTTLAVFLHEIPHEVGSFSILLHGGFTRRKALFVNFISSLSAILGAVVALVLGEIVQSLQNVLIPIAAGGLLYIAGSDLIPELHKESHNVKSALLQILMLIVGIATMLLLLVVG